MAHNGPKLTLGALVENEGTRFRIWAPAAKTLELVFEPDGRAVPMNEAGDGYLETFVEGVGAGTLYRYRMNGGDLFPDPASRYQPYGVHGPSEVIDPHYPWRDEAWQGVPQKDLVFYELHVGTFSPEGTYAGVEQRLPFLRDLGVTALELMPLADFAGERGWGYDPAAQFAPSRAYGRPEELRSLIDEAHALGMAVYLDVVYNHFGPDGAYVVAFAPQFFTDRHTTPWGQAINLDDEGSHGVRNFFLENALHWLQEYHFDGFRLDAAFALIDDSPKHFLTELSEVVEGVPGPKRLLVAEDHRNERLVVTPREQGGHGLHAVWADDFHHQVRSNLAGDNYGYYRDHSGSTHDIAATIRQGWFYTGQYSEHEGHERGTKTTDLPPERFVFAIQNHDQIGNRPHGNRLTDDISLQAYRAASALLLFVPQLPLLFMGQEWASSTPFQYFTNHHTELGKLVSKGRKEEFKAFPDFAGEVPDPQDEATFRRSILNWEELEDETHDKIWLLYQDLLHLRRNLSGNFSVEDPVEHGLVVRRGKHTLLVAFKPDVDLPLPPDSKRLWDSEDRKYADQSRLPNLFKDAVHFPVPAALILEQRA